MIKKTLAWLALATAIINNAHSSLEWRIAPYSEIANEVRAYCQEKEQQWFYVPITNEKGWLARIEGGETYVYYVREKSDFEKLGNFEKIIIAHCHVKNDNIDEVVDRITVSGSDIRMSFEDTSFFYPTDVINEIYTPSGKYTIKIKNGDEKKIDELYYAIGKWKMNQWIELKYNPETKLKPEQIPRLFVDFLIKKANEVKVELEIEFKQFEQ
ncbi:MAG: hypothetical protein QW244_01440 [Candidatus Pacearchaeota archaeon]